MSAADVAATCAKERAVAAALRDASQQALVARRGAAAGAPVDSSLSQQSSALLMELRSLSEALIGGAAVHEREEVAVRRRVADVEEQLRMLKYQRAQLRRAIAACKECGGEAEVEGFTVEQ